MEFQNEPPEKMHLITSTLADILTVQAEAESNFKFSSKAFRRKHKTDTITPERKRNY